MNFMFIIVGFLIVSTTSASQATTSPTTNSLNSTQDNINGSIHVENTCLEYKPQSCSGVCGQFFALWCSCDKYCQVYGRCCYDYESDCKEESEKAKQDHENLMNVTVECDSNISGYNVPQQIITSCSLTNISLKTIELCEEESRSSVIVSKVMSKMTGIHYKNRYCMLCNGEDEDDIVYWPTMIGSYSRRKRFNSMTSILELFLNSVKIIPPPNSKEIICYPSMVSSCSPNATQEEKRSCRESLQSPIRHEKLIYKNTFCLQCNGILEPTDNCFPAKRKDLYYGTYEQSFSLSMIFNWKKNRETFVLIDSPMSLVQNMSCSLDDNENLKECSVRQCVGTIQVINNTCQLLPNHFGCILYIFRINFTVPSNSSSEMTQEVELISSKLVQLAAHFERMHNVTKYYSTNVTLYNISFVDDHITGIIILNRMAYYLCNSQFAFVSSTRYYEYLDSNLAFNRNGSISTKRYSVGCHYWCKNTEDVEVTIRTNLRYQRSFTRQAENDIDPTSSVTNYTPISIYLISLTSILVAQFAQILLINI
ncbi:hypothetical protein LOTGIDRAFT_155184 [Lottia gigantea]|uniref:SMB domain-containing protein n=1 Tax=Lottia gigantea TaxID=225164 RepID=V3Z4S2_LOTGI|nr:hypothetical protein LOTGIDRAFT_155184 [Lottia gigantea]ESO85693.1 hypothetical protein LOTGIDRAFT_155184 [Lottia gigantea]